MKNLVNPKQEMAVGDFGPLGLSLVHDISGSMAALLLDIERLRLDASAIEQAIQAAQQQILGLGAGLSEVRYQMRRCIDEFAARCQEKDIQLELHAPKDFEFRGNPAKLHLVISNLIRNAIDAVAATRNPVIRLRLYEHKGTIRLEVTDNGIGISHSKLRRIFTAGYSGKQGKGHMGIGLNLVKHIVERDLRGTITARSGGGQTTFTVTMPYTK